MQSKQFHLGDVLSITTGILMSPRKMDGVYDILNFMTQDDLFTHQLPRACKECAPFLLEQHPQLKGIVIEGVTAENFNQRLEDLCAQYGETILVNTVPKHAHEVIDPESELAEKIHPSNVIKLKM